MTNGRAWSTPTTRSTTRGLRANDPGGTAEDPIIVGSGGRPYVVFWEHDPGTGSSFFGPNSDPARIWVMRLNAAGTEWETVGGGPVQLHPDKDAALPWITIVDGRPWVSYFQLSPTFTLEARVARLADDGGSWEQVGGPVAEGAPNGSIERPRIATIDGTPTVALTAVIGEPSKRVHVFRPNAGGAGWQRVGDGPASPSGGDSTGVSIAGMGGTPWVSWSERASGGGGREVRVARLDGSAWRQAGSGYTAPGNFGTGDTTSLASINGFPWVAFTQDDGTSPGNQGPGCCNQARVARLEPAFGETEAFPGFDSATLLTETTTYGLPYPLSFEYGPSGAAGASTPAHLAQGDSTFALGEARGLSPATLYGFQAFATAGTPAPLVRGPRDHFATTPMAASTPGSPPAPAPASTPTSAKPKLIVAIVRAPGRVRRGGRVQLKFFSTDGGTADLKVRRGGRVVKRFSRTIAPGVSRLTWNTGRAAPRLYRLSVIVHSTDGRFGADAVNLRVVRSRRR